MKGFGLGGSSVPKGPIKYVTSLGLEASDILRKNTPRSHEVLHGPFGM